jgi:riboflavin synthase
MFTGIIREIGTVKSVKSSARALRLVIGLKAVASGLNTGDSIAVNGVCLTAVMSGRDKVEFDVMEETAKRSTIAMLKDGDMVNLERAVRTGEAFDGHFVQGHVDCVGKIIRAGNDAGGYSIEVEVPKIFEALYVEKGSVAIDGVSLTVGRSAANIFSVHIIPHTLKETTLGLKKPGDKVNVEFDIIGKYIAKASAPGRSSSNLTESFLKQNGFI